MLHLPLEYVKALEEVLGQSVSESALREPQGKKWLARTAKSVAEISEGLTRDRSNFIADKYLADRNLQEAYLAYFMSTNVMKLWPPLRELASSGFFIRRPELRHLDIGSGTGTAVWSLATYLSSEQQNIRTLLSMATDSLNPNLSTIERFDRAFKPRTTALEVTTSLWKLPSPAPDKITKPQYDLITLMNVLNEVPEEGDAIVIESIEILRAQGGAVIMIEPSAKEPSRRALRFRDRMVENGYHVYAPCTRTNECPALLEEDNWCHTAFDWERPWFIRAIDDLTGNLRLSLKSTYAVFLRQDLNVSDGWLGGRDFFAAGRVVSELFREKGRARAYICNERGRREYLLNKRDKSGDNSAFFSLDRYDLVQIQGAEEREADVRVGREAAVHRIVGADGCEYVDK